MNLDSSGQLGIGITAPTRRLHVEDGGVIFKDGTTQFSMFPNAIYHHAKYHVFRDDDIDNTERFRIHTNGKVGINQKEPQEILDVTGNIKASGSVVADGVTLTSDDRLKHNEQPITDALGTINKLKLYKYDKTDVMLDADFNGELGDISNKKEVGFIAQDVAEIPELKFLVGGGGTVTEELSKKTVDLPFHLNYNGINNIAVQAIQELSKRVKDLELKLASLNKE